MASIIRLSEQPAGKNRILFANPDNLARDAAGQEIPGAHGERRNLTLKLSYDETATWPVSKTLEAGWSGYSDLAVANDGTILCFYEHGSADGKSDTKTGSLSFARLNLEWLTESRDALADRAR